MATFVTSVLAMLAAVMLVSLVLAHFGIVVLLASGSSCSGATSAATVSERHHVRTLSPYSRMALVVRGWGLEAVVALGVVAALARRRLPRRRRASGVLVAGTASCLALWRSERLRRRLAGDVARPLDAALAGRVLVACEVISRHGLIPRVEAHRGRSRPASAWTCASPPGLTAEQIDEAAETMAAAIGAREVRVVREPANAAVAHLSILWRDPLSVPAPPWPGAPGSLWEPLSLGVDEDGNGVSIGLVERNVLLGGEPGAGKSVALVLFIAAAALDPEVRLTLMDGKQVELAPWAGSAEHFVGPDMGDAIEVLEGPVRRDGPALLGPPRLGPAQDRAGLGLRSLRRRHRRARLLHAQRHQGRADRALRERSAT